MFRIGVVQAGAVRNTEENLKTMEGCVRQAKEQGCQALCFPEVFLTGYYPKEAENLALAKNHALLAAVSELAKEHGLDILCGFMEAGENANFLTHGIFRKNGENSYYRKTHLGDKEAEYFAAGDRLEVFELSCGLRCGFQICVETHFPEITGTLSLRGAEVVFAPHAVPRKAGSREKLWGRIIPARSYDCRVYMACCNLLDEENYGGGCLVTDPAGETAAADYSENAGILIAEVSKEQVECYRKGAASKRFRYYPEKRRPWLYQ